MEINVSPEAPAKIPVGAFLLAAVSPSIQNYDTRLLNRLRTPVYIALGLYRSTASGPDRYGNKINR